MNPLYTNQIMNFLVVEDHLILAIGAERVLKEKYPQATVDIATNMKDALSLVSKNIYAAAILDIRIEDNDSTNMIEQLLIRQPTLKAIVFSQSSEMLNARVFLKKGAKGYLSKQSKPEDLIEAVSTIMAGKIYLSEAMKQYMAREFSMPDVSSNPLKQISDREFEVINLLIEGFNSAEIAKALNVHVSTIGTHKSNIYDKLKIKNIVQLQELVKLYSSH